MRRQYIQNKVNFGFHFHYIDGRIVKSTPQFVLLLRCECLIICCNSVISLLHFVLILDMKLQITVQGKNKFGSAIKSICWLIGSKSQPRKIVEISIEYQLHYSR